jgi:hypothetical protein
MFGILGTVLCLGVGMCLLGKMCWRPAKFAFVLLAVVGVASVLGGLGMFGSHRNSMFVEHTRSIGRHRVSIDDDLVPRVEVDVPFGFEDEHQERHVPKGVMIALGTVLVIAGWLLVNRERTQPLALRAFTVLGLAAGAFILVSFFASPPHSTNRARDRVVRDVAVAPRVAPVIVVRDTEDAPQATRAKTPKRTRAKRPASRPERSETAQDLLDQMPARAGAIPVETELAAPPETPREPAAPEVPAASPQEPAAPAQTPAPEPAPPAVETPATPSEPTTVQPAKSEPAPAAASAPAPEPPVEPAPQTAPAAAPSADVNPPPTAKPSTDEPAAGSVAQAEEPLAPRARPAWLDVSGSLDDDSVYRVAVNSGPWATVPECQRWLEQAIKTEADHYIDEVVGESGASNLVAIPRKYLLDHVKKDQFNEVVDSPTVGPMHQIHALLEFDDAARTVIHDRWRNAVVTHRLWYAGSAGALVLGLLGTLFGYLKLDLKTGGNQKGRLQLAATLVALIVAAGALLLRWAVPF